MSKQVKRIPTKNASKKDLDIVSLRNQIKDDARFSQ